jgi:hypothetical protein
MGRRNELVVSGTEKTRAKRPVPPSGVTTHRSQEKAKLLGVNYL